MKKHTLLFFFFALSCLIYPSCTHFKKAQKKDPPSIAVIIGPGGALTLSAIGVLKAFQEYNIPIQSVLGIGWGAWIAAVYSKNRSVDEIQWSFYKLLKRGFFEKTLLKNPLKAKNISSLDQSLKENFSSQKTKINFLCPSLNFQGQKIWHDQKFLKNAVSSCLKSPPFFKIDKAGGGSLFSVRKASELLREKNIDLIFWINPALDPALFPPSFSDYSTRFFWQELQNSFQLFSKALPPYVKVISPNLKGFYLDDFSKIKNIILIGEKEGDFFIKNLQNDSSKLIEKLFH